MTWNRLVGSGGFLLAVGVLFAPLAADAADKPQPIQIPDIIGAGLERYMAEGAEAAIRAWVAGGPLESEEFVQLQSSGLHRIEDFYGKFEGSDLIRAQELTPRLRAVYLTLYFEKGSAFCYLLCYQTASGSWVVSDFDGSNSPRRILPEYGATASPIVTPGKPKE
jgi:hypothetical protein